MIRLLETLLCMAVAAVAVILLGRIGPTLGWPMPATLALPAAVFLLLGIWAARPPRERRHGQ